MRKYGLLAVFAVLIFVVGSLSACAGGTGSQPPDPPKNFVIAISPTSVSLVAGKTQQFQIVVSVNGVPTPANDYNLFVNDVPGGNATVGTIVTSGTQKGFYTAPATVPNPATVTVKAVIIADPSKSAIAIVTILDVSAVTSVTASCDPTTVLANQTSQCTATAQGTGGFNPAVTWSASVGTITSSGLFTAPASAGTATITATSVQTPTVSGTANITVNPPPPLTVSLSETATTVVLGGSHSFTATPSDPAATISWSLSGPGSLSVPSGTVSVYSVPTSVPTGFSATITVTATLGAQTATATVAITLNYPPAVINGATPRNIFMVREGLAAVTFSGSGFYPGCTYQFDGTGTATALPVSATFSQFTLVFIFDTPHFDPRAHTIALDCTSNGNGAGSSNAFGFSFLGNQNTIALSATQIFQLDQGAGIVHVFDLDTLAFVRDISVGRLVYAIAYDNGRLVASRSNTFAVVDGLGGGITISLPMAVGIKDNIACTTQDQANNLICFDASVLNPTPQSISIGTTPMEVAMTTASSGQLFAVVLNAGDGTIAVAPVPLPAQGTTIPSVRLPGMTVGHGEQTGTSGGTQLTILEYYTDNQSTPMRIAAVTSRFDKLIWFVDVSNPTQSLPIVGPFSLSGDPYRLAVDTANKAVVVALADYNAADGSAITRFVRFNPASGAATVLNSTTSFILSGLAVNPVSGQIIACGGANCIQVPNN